jgi:hypothetical protein
MDWKTGSAFSLHLTLPAGMTAQLDLPAPATSKGVTIDGKPVAAKRAGSRWLVETSVSGDLQIVVQ